MSVIKRFLARLGLDNNGQTLVNVADPVNPQDAATKNYALAKAGDTSVGTLRFLGSASLPALQIRNVIELATIVAAAPAATQVFYVANGAMQYYTVNATANWTLNVAWSSGTTLDAVMAVGDVLTIAMVATIGATPFFPTGFQIDGVAVTLKWQDGVAPTAGDASSLDIYTYTIIQTAAATYVAVAAQTQYK